MSCTQISEQIRHGARWMFFLSNCLVSVWSVASLLLGEALPHLLLVPEGLVDVIHRSLYLVVTVLAEIVWEACLALFLPCAS